MVGEHPIDEDGKVILNCASLLTFQHWLGKSRNTKQLLWTVIMIAPVINRTNNVESKALDPIQKNTAFTENMLSISPRKKLKRTSRTVISEGKKLKPLAIWTSLVSAKTLTSFIEANFRKVYSPDLKVVALEDLSFAESNLGEEYELVMVSIYEKDSFSKQSSQILKKLARRTTSPLTICYSGSLSSPGARKWQSLLADLRLSRSELQYSLF